MKKDLLISIVITFALVSCGNNSGKSVSVTNNKPAAVDELIVVHLKDFHSQAENLVGKTIVTIGTVDHVCKHGGQKMVIVSKDTDKRLKVFTGENMAAFNSDLEGENVMVVGIVEEQRIDENYLREWEEQVKSDGSIKKKKEEKLHTSTGKGKQEMENDPAADLEQINNLRQKLKESGKDHLSFYSLVCNDYRVTDADESSE